MFFHTELLRVILATNPRKKNMLFDVFYRRYRHGELVQDEGYVPEVFTVPSYAAFCKVVAPQDVPRRKNPATPQGQVLMLHSIAHIEYSAIDLALDHAYRFTGLPKAYYDDWLAVADDEFRHFKMLEKLLKELHSFYGALPVHNALFEAGQKTQTFLERMAVVPRYFEANGLDATPQILKKLRSIHANTMNDAIVNALQLILEEEVDHVRKGDVWFSYACRQAGVTKAVYFEIIKRLYPRGIPRQKFLNVPARKAAGFSCSELNIMADETLC